MWVSDAELTNSLALPREPSGTEWWLIGAEIKEDTDQLGLWVQIESIQDLEQTRDLVRESSVKRTGLTLLPWSIIRRAQLHEIRPPAEEFGFRQRW